MTTLMRAPTSADGLRPARLPAWLIPAAIVLVLAASATGLVVYSRQEQAEVVSRLGFGISRAKGAVVQWEADELDRARRWAADPSVVSAAGVIPAPLAALAKNAVNSDGIRAIALFSAQGAMLSSTAPQLLSDPMLGQRLASIQRARAGTASVAGPIWPAATRDGSEAGSWLLVAATPVLDAEGRAAGVLAFFFDTDAPLRRVRVAVRPDSRADAYLIDERGMVISNLGREGSTDPTTTTAQPVDAADTPAARSAEGVSVRPYVGPTGRAVVAAWTAAPPLAARVVFEMEARTTAAILPIPLGYLLAGLLAIAALLVVVQQRGIGRLRAESRAWREELTVVVESAPNAVLVADARGQITRANRRAVHLFDAQADAIVGTSLERWLRTAGPFRPDRLPQWLEGAAKDAKARRADGDEVPVDVRVGTGESDGRAIHIVVLLDRAALHGAEQSLREARGEADKARKSQTEFLSVMSQEIRTPMSRVMGMAHLLKDSALSPVQQGYVESLMRSSQMMMTFVTDVLDLSKIESGALQLIEAPFDVRAAVTEVAALCDAQSRENETTLAAHIKDRTPAWVVGDAGRFRQVLINLVGNGIRFAPGGRVDVRLEGTREDQDVALKVQVIDNGPGMDAETQRRLFAKDHTTVSKLAGGGLGISMAKNLAELMHGKLEVKSLQGEGTTFSFLVRLKAAVGVESPEAEAVSVLAGQRALIVDNAPGGSQVTRELLRSFGMRVETTTTAEEAMGHLRRAASDGDPVEIAMVDRQTVGELGDAFARRMRADPAISGVGLLIAASGTGSAEADRLGAAGCDAVIAKPFGAQSLSRTLAAVVKKPREERGRGPIIRADSLAVADAHAGAAPTTAPRPESVSAPHPPAAERVDGHIQIIEEPSFRKPEPPPRIADGRLRVLLAEDNRVNQIVATNLLQRLGCRVEVVGDGTEAVRQAARHEYDLIFMDIQMPNMDGLAATKLIRQLDPAHARVHIVALGTSASPEEHDRYIAAGMDDVVIKPITPETIQSAIERRPAGLERLAS
ncbi:MAG: response regulator [Gemmatimonadetes bacterium]|nr:response regulator [Gemmatimonadota bacterium]